MRRPFLRASGCFRPIPGDLHRSAIELRRLPVLVPPQGRSTVYHTPPGRQWPSAAARMMKPFRNLHQSENSFRFSTCLMEDHRPVRRPRVLVIGDDSIIAETLRIILELAGFEAICASGGIPGLRLAWSWRPDILVTDFDMPGLNGVDVARWICAIIPDCRPFLLSGHLEAEIVVAESRRDGYEIELLRKPIHPADLLARLSRAVDATSSNSRQGCRPGDTWNRYDGIRLRHVGS